ncbi:DUF3520 domain-containing protein [Aureibaculum algae]|uniref:DUF3520 domain-containing protein n=1 Tax=Aureibaculum algae TaxID=2584122 RepID=A0A5B7TT46_9FLAO|nr:von Willebrand factor type A domain-containing protein [Aureibaculum algae]QCX38481.1 DUF3520 domain-containing protein [Aureibaculum algae]
MKKVIILVFVALVALTATGQEKLITGKVSDETGPLPGVSVLVKGTSNGTQTDFDGKYSIKANLGDILIYSFVGMKSEQKMVGKNEVIDVVLEADNVLEEVVVVGYGISRKSKSLSYSVSTIGTADKALKGKITGVQITNTNNIKIRGTSSLSNKNQPLYIIDGNPVSVDSKEFKKLNPNQIKNVSVLKNNTAASIYGNRATNGAIIISTKQNNYESESYKKIKENEFKHVSFSPLSTFSIDVDKAGYSNVRRLLNNGSSVPADAVKIEEMINYFDYDYPQPVDEHPFAINTELASSPWSKDSKILKIGLQGKEILNKNIPPSNLVFLIDVSGSMSNANKLPLLKSAFKLLVNQLRDEDKVSIVVYAGAAGVVLKPTSGSNKTKIIEALENLSAGGSTAGGEGINLAYKIAEQNFKKKGNNRVILATDGDFNIGASSDDAMEELIKEKRKSGIFLTALGFGMGNYQDSKLETLADKGNGNHAYIDTMQEAKRVLVTEFGGTLFTIAKDVKIQVEFNPNKIEAYRLIGYENRLLADEDFIDDKKDAGELGSNHSVTALYEIIPKGKTSKFLKEIGDLKYSDNTSKDKFKDELVTIKFRYKKPKGTKSIEMVHVVKDNTIEFDNASNDLRFASAVALFGMKLRASQISKEISLDDIIKIAENAKGKDKFGYRSEFTRLVDMTILED